MDERQLLRLLALFVFSAVNSALLLTQSRRLKPDEVWAWFEHGASLRCSVNVSQCQNDTISMAIPRLHNLDSDIPTAYNLHSENKVSMLSALNQFFNTSFYGQTVQVRRLLANVIGSTGQVQVLVTDHWADNNSVLAYAEFHCRMQHGSFQVFARGNGRGQLLENHAQVVEAVVEGSNLHFAAHLGKCNSSGPYEPGTVYGGLVEGVVLHGNQTVETLQFRPGNELYMIARATIRADGTALFQVILVDHTFPDLAVPQNQKPGPQDNTTEVLNHGAFIGNLSQTLRLNASLDASLYQSGYKGSVSITRYECDYGEGNGVILFKDK